MLSPELIKNYVANLQLSIRDADHFDALMNGLTGTLNDEKHLNDFDSFAFAWTLLPPWAKTLLLSMAYREDKAAFTGITPVTPIEQLNDQQRAVLSQGCEKFLAATVTLFADYDFTEDFYKRWAEARRQKLQQQDATYDD